MLVSGMLAVSLAACTGSEPGAGGTRAGTNEGTSTASPPVSPASSGCVDTAGRRMTARDGAISAGPFEANRGYWRAEHGTKFWVATSVNQKPTTAVIHAERLHSTAPPIVKRRGPDTIATLGGDPSGLFFPGLLRLPQHGIWQITVTIGKDSGCFRVHV